MKKVLIFLAVIVLIYMIYQGKKDYYIIPNEAIRFRIIANSNSTYDQYIKIKVKNKLETSFKKDISMSESIEKTRSIINNNLNLYRKTINDIFKEEKYNKEFSINYGMNYFPEKIYKDVKYEAGEYESLLITIGDGKGDNWWCVLFPPICTMESQKKDDIEYKFFIKEIIEKYFK